MRSIRFIFHYLSRRPPAFIPLSFVFPRPQFLIVVSGLDELEFIEDWRWLWLWLVCAITLIDFGLFCPQENNNLNVIFSVKWLYLFIIWEGKMGSSTQCAGSITYNNQNENITLAKQSNQKFSII